MMSPVVEGMLKSFDGLSSQDQREVIAEMLRRSRNLEWPPLTDGDLVQIADAIFVQLDEAESRNE